MEKGNRYSIIVNRGKGKGKRWRQEDRETGKQVIREFEEFGIREWRKVDREIGKHVMEKREKDDSRFGKRNRRETVLYWFIRILILENDGEIKLKMNV